jgi:hypothetical protein
MNTIRVPNMIDSAVLPADSEWRNIEGKNTSLGTKTNIYQSIVDHAGLKERSLL